MKYLPGSFDPWHACGYIHFSNAQVGLVPFCFDRQEGGAVEFSNAVLFISLWWKSMCCKRHHPYLAVTSLHSDVTVLFFVFVVFVKFVLHDQVVKPTQDAPSGQNSHVCCLWSACELSKYSSTGSHFSTVSYGVNSQSVEPVSPIIVSGCFTRRKKVSVKY